ncbi:MAG: GTP 3',8-cyclase MoaA [Deltaproteobacteria bacterium]|jgi:cyclic pyranopterin phosphate synthase|nr:GTP 3',8-cyclase MoaA [Deltaproteobacteria bacterium]
MQDSFGRKIDYARISITDRCNLRCVYCVTDDARRNSSPAMDFETIVRLCKVLANLGVRKFKITGGEPTLRPDVVELIGTLKSVPGIDNVTLTTNGLRLAGLAGPLAEAGLDSVNVSLDSLDPALYRKLSGENGLEAALEGLRAASSAGIPSVKVNCVPLAETPADDLLALAGLARDAEIHVRFIELMPIGPGASLDAPLTPDALFRLLTKNFGTLEPAGLARGNGPAVYYGVPGFRGLLGFISALGSCFCEKCNRIRVTSDGCLKTCLHLDRGALLPLDDERALAGAVLEAVKNKPRRHMFLSGAGPGEADDRPMSRIGG